jgi:hypothetical protein
MGPLLSPLSSLLSPLSCLLTREREREKREVHAKDSGFHKKLPVVKKGFRIPYLKTRAISERIFGKFHSLKTLSKKSHRVALLLVWAFDGVISE